MQRLKGVVGAWIPSPETPSVSEWSWYVPHLPLRVPLSDAPGYIIKPELPAPLTIWKRRQSAKGSRCVPTQGHTSIGTCPSFWQNLSSKQEPCWKTGGCGCRQHPFPFLSVPSKASVTYFLFWVTGWLSSADGIGVVWQPSRSVLQDQILKRQQQDTSD